MEEKRVWGIHTMNDFMFLNRNVIAIGWKAMGDLGTLDADREAFKKKYASVYPEAKLQQVANSAGMLYRFVFSRPKIRKFNKDAFQQDHQHRLF